MTALAVLARLPRGGAASAPTPLAPAAPSNKSTITGKNPTQAGGFPKTPDRNGKWGKA
jgi:hypothetical protein